MNPPVTFLPYMLAYSGMAHLTDVVFPFDALLELAPKAVLVVHERMVQLQPGTAVLPDSISHLLHQNVMSCVSRIVNSCNDTTFSALGYHSLCLCVIVS